MELYEVINNPIALLACKYVYMSYQINEYPFSCRTRQFRCGRVTANSSKINDVVTVTFILQSARGCVSSNGSITN